MSRTNLLIPRIKVCEDHDDDYVKVCKIFIFLVDSLECDDHFNELEDFGEISTIALPDDNNFVINNGDEVDEKLIEMELSCDDSKSKKDDGDIKLE